MLLFACQPTPEQDVVVQKNTDALIEKARSREIGLTDLPSSYQASFTSKGGRLFVEADAAIDVPTTTLPVIRVRPCGFDREQVKKIANVLLGEHAHYVDNDAPRTKAAILRQAAELQADMEDWDTVQRKYLQYDTIEEAEQALEQMMRDAAAAPEILQAIEPSYAELPLRGTLESVSDVYISVTAMPDDATYSRLTAMNMPEIHYVRLDYMRDDTISIGISSERIEMTEQAALTEAYARKICDDAIAKMGLEGYTFYCAYPNKVHFGTVPVYELYYTFAIGDAQMTFANPDTNDVTDYAAPWEQSEIHFTVDEKGILTFSWKNPFTVEQTEAEQSALLSFNNILSIFEKNVVLVQNQVDFNEIYPDSTETLHVTRVRLGLVSVREKDASTGLLVPAWDFFGYRSGENAGKPFVFCTNEQESFLTINAVDGSIISRARGY